MYSKLYSKTMLNVYPHPGLGHEQNTKVNCMSVWRKVVELTGTFRSVNVLEVKQTYVICLYPSVNLADSILDL